MTESATIGMLLIGSYLLGSLPFGLWLARWWKGVDVRTLGSGNIGSTNVGRICGPVAGAIVFAFDVGKGLVPPLVGQYALRLPSQWVILAAMLAIIGHNYSVWLGFKGGKGIATSLGALLGVAPPVGLTAFALFGLEILTLRWVSLGSIIAALSLPVLMPIFYPGDTYRLAFGIVACIMAVYKHRANIHRLRAGTEPKVSLPWTKKPVMPPELPEPSASPSPEVETDHACVTPLPEKNSTLPSPSQGEEARLLPPPYEGGGQGAVEEEPKVRANPQKDSAANASR